MYNLNKTTSYSTHQKSRRILLWWTLYMFLNYSVKLRLLDIEARHKNHSKKNKIAQIRTAIKGIHISLYTWKLTDRDAWQSLSKKIKWSLLFDLIMPGQSQWDVAAKWCLPVCRFHKILKYNSCAFELGFCGSFRSCATLLKGYQHLLK